MDVFAALVLQMGLLQVCLLWLLLLRVLGLLLLHVAGRLVLRHVLCAGRGRGVVAACGGRADGLLMLGCLRAVGVRVVGLDDARAGVDFAFVDGGGCGGAGGGGAFVARGWCLVEWGGCWGVSWWFGVW